MGLSAPGTEWALALFDKSVLKQAKLRRILELLEDPRDKSSLDVGADNGVISYLLRQRGGRWCSADLDPRAVASIRQLVGDEVYQLEGAATPFPDRSFDQVVVVDYLEHIPDDRAFARELERILKPGGAVILNVPHLQPGSPLNRFRHLIGLTDAWHGHLRPGYTAEGLAELLGPRFVMERVVTYSRAGSELVDTALNGMYEVIRKRRGAAPSSKGTVVTEADLRRHRKPIPPALAALPGLPAGRRGRPAAALAGGAQAHRARPPS